MATGGTDAGMTLNWTYDRYGNRWSELTTGTGGGPIPQSQLSFTGNNNRIDGYTYDSAGNLLNDGTNTYTYDAEGRIKSINNGTVQYVYDAEGNRVAKLNSSGAVTSVYILNAANQQITELNGSGAWQHSNIYAPGGRLLATYDAPGQTSPGYHFNLTDWLGTKRMQTTSGGNQQETCMSYPSGDGLICSGGADATEQHFTGKDRDVESGLDYFYARYYSSNLGRFMTPDWAGKPTAVPYANFGDPQSLNLYAYVGNNAINGVDANGHCADPGGYDCLQEGQAQNPMQGNYASWDADQYMQGYGTGGTNYWAQATQDPPKPPGDSGSFQCSVLFGDNYLTNNFQITPESAVVSFWPEGAGGLGHIGIGINSRFSTFGYATALNFPNNVLVKAGAFLLPIPWEGTLRKDQDTYPGGDAQYLRIPITPEQASAMQQAIDQRQANEGIYNLIFHNCAEFVEDVLHAGGFAGVPGHSVFLPRELWSDLTQ